MEEASASSMEGASSRPSGSAPISRASSEEGDFFDSHHPESDQEDDGPGTNSSGGGYTASEIAGRFIKAIDGKARVDTAAPIDSVKGAVSKFGGILDWRERRQQVQEEMDKVAGESAEYQRRSRAAEAGRAEAQQDLMGATGEIDDLWLSVKRAQIAEAQARKDADLAKLRLRKSEKRAAARAELDGVKERHAAARAELGAVRAELEALRKERDAVAEEAGAAAARARETAGDAVVAGEAVREAAAELAALQAELDSARAAHDVAEEKRLRLALALQEDKVQWQTELEQSEQEARRLSDELVAAGDLASKVAAASEHLANLRAELFARAVEGASAEDDETPAVPAPSATLAMARKELEEVKASVEKAQDEAKILHVAAASLSADLEKEKAELAKVRRKEEASSASIPSLEEELGRVTSELTAAQARARDSGEERSTKPEQLSEARREAERAKACAQAAQEEIAVAREEARVAKAAVQTMEARLEAVMREILATNASAETATASADALVQQQDSKGQSCAVEGGVALAVEEYEELSRRARDTEEVAGKRVVEAVKLIKDAKDAEVRSMEKLTQVMKQTEQRRQALRAATAEAEEAELGKVQAERELRHLQAEQRRAGGSAGGETGSPRTGLAEISAFDGGGGRGNPHILSPRGGYMPRADMAAISAAEEADGKQKKPFFPRMVMFLAKKKAQNWNGK